MFWPLCLLYAKAFFPLVRHFFCIFPTDRLLPYGLASAPPALYSKPRVGVTGGCTGGCLSCDLRFHSADALLGEGYDIEGFFGDFPGFGMHHNSRPPNKQCRCCCKQGEPRCKGQGRKGTFCAIFIALSRYGIARLVYQALHLRLLLGRSSEAQGHPSPRSIVVWFNLWTLWREFR